MSILINIARLDHQYSEWTPAQKLWIVGGNVQVDRVPGPVARVLLGCVRGVVLSLAPWLCLAIACSTA